MNHAINNEISPMPRRWAMIQAAAALCLGVFLATGWAPTAKFAGSAGVVAMFSAAGMIWFIAGLSLAPALWLLGGNPKTFALAVLAAGVIRFVLTLLAAVPIVLVQAVPVVPFLVWIIISYLAVLAADTAMILYFMNAQRN